MTIRRAAPEDAEAVAATFTAAFAGLLTYLPRLHTPEEDRAFFARAIDEREVWIAEEDGAVLGLVAIDGDELGHLYVHPDHQSSGIGTALLEHVKRERPGGFELWVFQQNEGARRFYERHGLRLVRETDGSANEERTPDALYEWRPGRMTIRRAGPGDAAGVADVFLAARAPMTYAPVAYPEADVRRDFGSIVIGRLDVWVGEEAGRIVAFAALSAGELEHLYVHPGAQGRGLGSELLALAKRERPDGFRVWVFQQNAGARRLYERHGCVVVRETDGSRNVERAPDALYEWRPPGGGATA